MFPKGQLVRHQGEAPQNSTVLSDPPSPGAAKQQASPAVKQSTTLLVITTTPS